MTFAFNTRLLTLSAALLAAGTSVAVATQGPKAVMQGYYQQSTNTFGNNPLSPNGVCTASSSCSVIFAKIPNGKQVVVRNVSCTFSLTTGVDMRNATFLFKAADNSFPFQNQYLVPTRAADTEFNINNSTIVLLDQGSTPRIDLRAADIADFTFVGCTIAGEIYNAP